MRPILIFVELLVAVALVVSVLLQRSEGGALGMGGGGSGLGGLFSPRGAADTLTRTTAVLAVLFFLTCLALNLLAQIERHPSANSDSPSSTPASSPPVQRAPLPSGGTPRPSVPTPH